MPILPEDLQKDTFLILLLGEKHLTKTRFIDSIHEKTLLSGVFFCFLSKKQNKNWTAF